MCTRSEGSGESAHMRKLKLLDKGMGIKIVLCAGEDKIKIIYMGQGMTKGTL